MLAISASIRILYSIAIVVLLFKGKPNAERAFEKKKKILGRYVPRAVLGTILTLADLVGVLLYLGFY